jgi:hypothetical protein
MADPTQEAAPLTRRRISATALAQYVRFGSCDRLLYYVLHPEKARELEARWRVRPQPLTPLLHAAGEAFEAGVVARVTAAGEQVLDLTGRDTGATIEHLREAAGGRRLVLAQPALAGEIGFWPCGGNADLIWLAPQEVADSPPGGPAALSATVVDVKASLVERVEHRLQVAFYVRLLRQMAARVGITLAEVRGAVLHREEGDPLPAIGLADLSPFDLAPYELVLDHLLVGPDAVVEQIASRRFEEVPFSLTFKCDGCLFNGHCMHDSAAHERVALVPYLSGAEQRVLEQHGLRTFRDLAGVTLPAGPSQYRGPLAPGPGQEEVLGRLRSHWQLEALDRHTQRARALLRARDGGRTPYEPAIDAGFGTLPAEDAHPGLVQVFVDAQHDYVRDGVYLLVALVRGPDGERVVLERTGAPVDREAEAGLLERWVPAVYGAVLAVAGAPEAFVHLYAYSRYDQSVLLAALRRHAGRLPGVAALFDLLTDTAALAPVSPLAQPMVSFLAEEVRDRLTLDVTCASLHEVATRLGSKWVGPTPSGASTDFRARFRARVFDSRRQVDLPVPAVPPQGTTRPVWIEGAARFRSQIPLEYAYGAWGCLPAPTDALQERLLQPFRDVTWDELEGFAAQRMRALAHVEGRIRPKSRYTGKKPLPLPALAAGAAAGAPLPRALQDFLLIEHHARTQELLLAYAQPIERRVQTGRALLLECLRYRELGEGNAEADCRVVFDGLGGDPVLAEQALRLKERDWVVVNPAGTVTPTAMVHGRLATLEGLERGADGQLTARLALKGLSPSRRAFAYWHRRQEALRPGERYAVDEMPDDLNGDKLLEACRVAADSERVPNPLLLWLDEALPTAAPPAGTSPVGPAPAGGTAGADVPPDSQRRVAAWLKTIDAVERAAERQGPTARQAEAIAGHLREAVLLVQGPPGSGKSHALGWAVLVRLAARRAAGATSFRVAVSSKTHNAIALVLRSVAEKLALLRRYAPYSSLAQAVREVTVYKIGGEDDAGAGAGLGDVRYLDAYVRRGQLDRILATPWLVVGATPGGLYSAQRYRDLGGQAVPWDERPFDLAVLDEASQVNVPEALLACAFVKPDGQALVVGDHRQMPPIVAAAWNEEARRTVVDSEVYRSVFDFLLGRGFPRVGLDQSFRLHRRLAAFLEQTIYRQDGIPFFSDREDALPLAPTGDPFVDAVLDPAQPVVVVEHGDAASHQFSPVELDLLTPLLAACTEALGLDSATGIGVVVPHRAQKAMLRARFPALARANAIDTVERFQGGERDVIVVSATASDPEYVLSEADFLLNPNRLNVALSRPRKKLIVVASATLFRVLVSDPDLFEQAALWKRLRYAFAGRLLWAGERAGTTVAVFGCRPPAGASPAGARANGAAAGGARAAQGVEASP